MKIAEKYTGEKTYMFPNGALATPEKVLLDYPAVLTFTHFVTTDENREVMFSIQNLSAMRGVYGIDSTLTEDEAIAAIEVVLNTPEPDPEPTAEERIAAALEYQNLTSM